MKKIILPFLLLGVLYSQNIYNNNNTGGVQIQVVTTNNEINSNLFYVQNEDVSRYIKNELTYIYDLANSRTYFNLTFDVGPMIDASRKYDSETIFSSSEADRVQTVFNWGMTFNLFQPKLINSHLLDSRLSGFREYLDRTKNTLSKRSEEKLTEIEEYTAKYRKRVISRMTISIFMPMVTRRSSADGQISTRVYPQETGLAVGMDIKDIININVGANLYGRIKIGIGFDITTPLFGLSQVFIQAVRRKYKLDN